MCLCILVFRKFTYMYMYKHIYIYICIIRTYIECTDAGSPSRPPGVWLPRQVEELERRCKASKWQRDES